MTAGRGLGGGGQKKRLHDEVVVDWVDYSMQSAEVFCVLGAFSIFYFCACGVAWCSNGISW